MEMINEPSFFHWFLCNNNMSIKVHGVDDDKKLIYPLHVLSTISPEHVDLLLIDLLVFECNGIQHYTTIRNFSRLVGRQMINHEHVVCCCKQCLHAYSTLELLDAHATDCCHMQRTKFPDDLRCRFTNIQKQLQSTFCSICRL